MFLPTSIISALQMQPSSSQPAAAQASLAAPDVLQPSASQDTSFTPRKEFIRSPKPVPNIFSLLAISASNCIRLYSFPLSFIVALRRLLEQQTSIIEYREDVQNSMCEFVLEGKPWANPGFEYKAKPINNGSDDDKSSHGLFL